MISVQAAALNFPDLLMTYGKYQFKPEVPFVVGMEGAGEVIELGPFVTDYKIGDKVLFRGKTGAVSQYKTCSAKDISPLPGNLSYQTGAAFGVTFQTAYIALVKRGDLTATDTVLIFGAGGGVGQASVAVAKAFGATVIACASHQDKLSIAREAGADYLINYQTENLVKRVYDITNGQGVTLVLDPVGGTVLEAGVECLCWQGRLLIVGFADGAFGKPNLRDVQTREISLIGVRAGEYGRRNPAAGQAAMTELFKLTESKNLQPNIGKVWSLEQTPLALSAMEARAVFGKQVIAVDSAS